MAEDDVAAAQDVASPPPANDPVLSDLCQFVVVLGKSSEATARPSTSTIGELRALIEDRLKLPTGGARHHVQDTAWHSLRSGTQRESPPRLAGTLKMLCGGKALKDDSATLVQAGIKKGSKVLLLGTGGYMIRSPPCP